MNMSLERIFSAYGQTVDLAAGGETRTIRVFLQPVRRTQTEEPVDRTPLGTVDQRRWLCIAPPEHPLSPGNQIRWGQDAFAVQESAAVALGGKTLYWRALLRPWKEAAQ